MGLVCIDI